MRRCGHVEHTQRRDNCVGEAGRTRRLRDASGEIHEEGGRLGVVCAADPRLVDCRPAGATCELETFDEYRL